jgi:hypothetical protein
MIRPQAHQNSREKIAIPPYEELFIYYLKGRLALSDQKFQNNYIAPGKKKTIRSCFSPLQPTGKLKIFYIDSPT